MSSRGRLLLLISLLISDALGVSVALILARRATSHAGPFPVDYLTGMAGGVAVWLICFAILRLYDLEIILEDSQEYATVATGSTYGVLLFIVISTLAGQHSLSAAQLFGGWLGSVFCVSLGRFLMRRVVRALRRRGHLIASALIVGADEQGRAIAHQLKSEADSGLRVVGFLDDFLPAGTVVQDGLRVLGHPGALAALAAEYRVAEIVAVPGAMSWESFQQVLEQIAVSGGPRIRLSPGYYDLLASTPRVAHRNFVPLIIVEAARLSGFDALLKAVLDYGLGTVLFVLLLPLMATVTLVLSLTGPAFVAQDFLGLGGRIYRAYTFRVAPGSWLRRTGLYFLPLLAAVIMGHLSLVGPRPIPVEGRDRYRRWLTSLASVKPGMTGPWAVVPVAALEEEMRAAMYYIRNWTIWLDLQILIQTALVILRSRWGALA